MPLALYRILVMSDFPRRTDSIKLFKGTDMESSTNAYEVCGQINNHDGPDASSSSPQANREMIVGGVQSPPRKYPWMVSVHRVDMDHNMCGAAIISHWAMLSAAHCFFDDEVENFKFYGDVIDQEKLEEAVKLEVGWIIIHPKFTHKECIATPDRQYDIALIKLKERLEFSWKIRAICLPSPDVDYRGLDATVIGWGIASQTYVRYAQFLREVDLHIDKDNCYTYPYCTNVTTVYCVGMTEESEKQDACHGDSGGPLMVMTENTYQLVGVLSFGKPCYMSEQVEKTQSIYTRVSSVLNWITKQSNTDVQESEL